MIIRLLEAGEAADLRQAVLATSFIGGRRTGVGWGLHGIKANSLIAFDDDKHEALTARVRAAFQDNQDFRAFASPKRWAKMRFAHYETGDEYGEHVDSPHFYNRRERVTTDLAFTLFLNDSGNYQGGELRIEGPLGPQDVKLDAGWAIIYPAGLVHSVLPVTLGERLVCAGWIESAVAGTDEREILYGLVSLRSQVTQGPPRLQLERAIAHLRKLWSRV